MGLTTQNWINLPIRSWSLEETDSVSQQPLIASRSSSRSEAVEDFPLPVGMSTGTDTVQVAFR